MGKLTEPIAKRGQILPRHRETARRRMSAIFAEQITAGIQPFKHIEFWDAPRRAANFALFRVLIGSDKHRHTVALHQPRRHNPDYAVMPSRLHHHQHPIAPNLLQPVGIAPVDRLGLNLRTHLLTLFIRLFAHHRLFQRHPFVIGGQQLDHGLRIADPTDRINPRPQTKADRVGLQRLFTARPGHLG